jgi:hypothetical protein
MRYPLAVTGLCAALIVGSQAGAAPKRSAFQKVQLISMTGGLPIADATYSPDISSSAVAPETAPLPDTFQVHDLSRRYVQFRMQQEMAAAAVAPVVAPILNSEPADVAAFSSIQIPGWLRGGIAD